MKVILKDSQKVIKVKDGYAFNYLLPRGLALPATPANLAKLAEEREKKEKANQIKKKTDQEKAKKLMGKTYLFELAGNQESGKLYQALTTKVIAEKLNIDKKSIKLKQPIKKKGEYPLEIKLGDSKFKVTIKVKIK